MKRYVLFLTFAVITLLAFTACSENRDSVIEETSMAYHDIFLSYESTDMGIYLANPFTVALLEYFADGVEGSPFGFDTWAGIVNIDGHATNGVLAIRHDLIDNFPVMAARVFYLFDGELFYYDIRNHEDFPQVMITHEGRLIQNVATGRYSQSFTVFGIRDDRVIPFQTVFVEIFDRDADDGANYYTIDDGWWVGIENASPMTKDDFDEFISRFGLFSFTSPHDINDETEQILVMSVEAFHEWRIGAQQYIEDIILTAGGFWEEWWNMEGIFNWGHIDVTPWEYWTQKPYDPRSMGFSRMLPESGYTSEDCIRNILLQFYTPRWIDVNVFGRGYVEHEETAVVLSGVGIPFVEYNGELFVMTARMGVVRPDWTTATHTLIEQSGNRTVVETVVTTYDHMGVGGELPTATIHFTFIDGRIDSGRGVWVWSE